MTTIGSWENTEWAKGEGIRVGPAYVSTLKDERILVWVAYVGDHIFAIADTPGRALETFDAAWNSPVGQAMSLPEMEEVQEVWLEEDLEGGERLTLWKAGP